MRSARCLVVAAGLVASSGATEAQGVSTAGIRGHVTADGRHDTDARVRVSDDATGFAVEVRTRDNRFLVQGLEPGARYTVTVTALGFAPARARGLVLTLGELREMNFTLEPLSTRLDTVAVVARAGDSNGEGGGTGTAISGEWLDHLPSLNRDMYDFVRLVPHVSTKISLPNPGFSAAGWDFASTTT